MKRWFGPGVVLLLVLLAVACFRWETRTMNAGMSREALLNPWLAAARLLEREGLRVRVAPEYGGLPPHARVIVLATPLDYLDSDAQEALLHWVADGGHLVSELQEEAEDDSAAPELLARRLDIQLRHRNVEAGGAREPATQKGLRPTRLDAEGTIQAHFNSEYYLVPGKHVAAWSARDRYGAHALRFNVGQGQVTLLSDMAWMHNTRLGDGDHAALLWRVLNAPRGAETWLVPGIERPSLLATLWDRAAGFLVAVALFVLTWLWSASRRFGPLAPPPEPARRRLGEHLEACGRYLMRHGGLAALHRASRQRLLGQLHRRHPQWRTLATPELAQRLAERARIEPAAVQRLLQHDAPEQLLPFAADIRLINRLRKAL